MASGNSGTSSSPATALTYGAILEVLDNYLGPNNGKYLIAGGFCSRAFNSLPFTYNTDIDIYIREKDMSDIKRRSVIQSALSFIQNKSISASQYSHMNMFVRIEEYWLKDFNFKIQFIVVRNDAVNNIIDVIETFDLNKSKYFWNSESQSFASRDIYPNELVVEYVGEGVSFADLFNRVAKYRKLYPKMPALFRIKYVDQ